MGVLPRCKIRGDQPVFNGTIQIPRSPAEVVYLGFVFGYPPPFPPIGPAWEHLERKVGANADNTKEKVRGNVGSWPKPCNG